MWFQNGKKINNSQYINYRFPGQLLVPGMILLVTRLQIKIFFLFSSSIDESEKFLEECGKSRSKTNVVQIPGKFAMLKFSHN